MRDALQRYLLRGLMAATLCLLPACSSDDARGDEADEPPSPREDGWRWVSVPGSTCGNGTPTGIGINDDVGDGAPSDLLIYLEGGGACWDTVTCLQFGSAVNLRTGYGATQFESAAIRATGATDRSLADNPFRNMGYVYFPYCTGDVHGGDTVQTYPGASQAVHHRGTANVNAFLPVVSESFPGVTRVFLTGSSAGAFGAQIQYERVAAAFPDAEVHLLADSGQMVNPGGDLLATWRAAWNLSVPEGCAECAEDFTRLPGYLAGTYPNRRIGLLAFTQDSVLRRFFNLEAAEFETRTRSLLAAQYDGRENARYFLVPGASHTMLGELMTLTGPGGASLRGFAEGWVSGGEGWANVSD